MTKEHTLFEKLFENSVDAQLVFCEETIERKNVAFKKLFGDLTSADDLFALSPEFQPNGELSAKMGAQELLEATVNGDARFEWLHQVGANTHWYEYILKKTDASPPRLHAIVRNIDEYKHQHLKSNRRIERMIQQNQAMGTFTAWASRHLKLKDFLQKVCKELVNVMDVSQAQVWEVRQSGTAKKLAGSEEGGINTNKLDLTSTPRFRKALAEITPLCIHNLSRDARVNELPHPQEDCACMIIPLQNEGNLQGFLWMNRPASGTWELEERSFSVSVAEIISKQIGTQQLQKTEKILEKREKVFQALIEHSLDVVCIIDKEGKFTYQSPSFKTLLGYKRSLVGTSSFELIEESDRKKLAFRFYRLLCQPDVENGFAFRVKHQNGEWRYVDALARNLLEDEAIDGIVVNFRDITERMTFQEQLRIKERYYRTLIEKSLDITATRDERGIITYVSPSIEPVLGISDTKLLGTRLNDLVHPDDKEQAEKDWNFILENPGTPLNFDQRIVLPSGSVRFVEGTARNLLHDSAVRGVVSNFRDTTAKHHAESALIDSQLRLEGIVSSAMDAIITIDQDFKVVLFNKAAETMFGYPAFEIFGKQIKTIFNQRSFNRVTEAVQALSEFPMGSREVLPHKGKRLKGLRSDGSRFPIDASISRQEIDNEVFFTAIIRDITKQLESEEVLKNYSKNLEKEVKKRTKLLNLTNSELNEALNELKNTQEQLIESEKMASLGQLTAGIAHEINNPINFVSSTIHPLKRDFEEIMDLFNELQPLKNEDDKKEFEYLFSEISDLLAGIEEGAMRTKNIVLGLRKFSRLDEDVFKKVDIHEGIDSTLMLLNTKLRGKIKVTKRYGQLPPVECRPGKINQVFMNIISNAIQAIPENGSISISTRLKDNKVIISIKDSGVGMNADVIKRVFEPFFTTKDVGIGTGLGLSISYGIIEEHGGKITVSSQPGKGAKFVISLPVSQL